ncbi:MAG: AI-2E family transporter [Bacteroidetes bacterium]|nr:AI-2E family transporter [Bacteroidota bacterium]MCL6099744.1 AI-2E family transporter [Bacteroidota bacterium]
MTELNKSSKGIKILVGAAAFVIIVAGINLAQSVVVLFLISFFLALLGAPAVLWLKEKHIPSGLAVLIVMAVMIIILFLIGAQIGTSFSGFTDELPLLQSRIRDQVKELSVLLTSKGIVVKEKFFLEYVNPEAVMKLTAGLLSGLSSVLSDLVLILLTVTFILLEVSSFPIKLRAILGDPKQAFPQFTKFVVDMKRYMVIKTVINLVAGILIALWMQILGVQFPVLWGFLAFLLHYLPNIGSVIAAIPAALLALVQLGMGSALLVVAGNIFIGFIIGNVIEPRLMGRKFGLSTLVVFLSLIFWGSLLGLIGAILCIPLTMTMKFAFESNESTRWIAVLLGSEIDEISKPISKGKKVQ